MHKGKHGYVACSTDGCEMNRMVSKINYKKEEKPEIKGEDCGRYKREKTIGKVQAGTGKWRCKREKKENIENVNPRKRETEKSKNQENARGSEKPTKTGKNRYSKSLTNRHVACSGNLWTNRSETKIKLSIKLNYKKNISA